jgi:hypothetical protein
MYSNNTAKEASLNINYLLIRYKYMKQKYIIPPDQ